MYQCRPDTYTQICLQNSLRMNISTSIEVASRKFKLHTGNLKIVTGLWIVVKHNINSGECLLKVKRIWWETRNVQGEHKRVDW